MDAGRTGIVRVRASSQCRFLNAVHISRSEYMNYMYTYDDRIFMV